MNNEILVNKRTQKEGENKISHYIPLGFQKRKESIFIQKGKEFMNGKKSVSMKHIFDSNDKISIKINQNININTNIKNIQEEKEEKEKDEKEKGEQGKNEMKEIKRREKKEKTKIKERFDQRDNKTNIDYNKDNESKEQSDEDIFKIKKMKSCVFNYESEKKKEKKLIMSTNLSRAKSRDIESSYKMEKLLEKQSKLETKEHKKEEFFEFYINDNNRNRIYKLKDNTVSTTKYNIFTFIPKGLLYQFSRASNIYFLFTAIIQSIPLISPLTSLTAIIPLIFVLGISMIREAIEDLVRNNYDNLNNEEEVIVFRNSRFVRAMSETLKHGEIILLYENKSIPADMILIDTGFGEGICYVETSSLDGEKTLKLKVANKYTQGFISDDIKSNKGIERYIKPGKYSFNGYIKINVPNIDLNYVNGTIHTLFKKEGKKIEQDIIISTNEFLLKGSILKNTNWVIGIVVYTGMSNKIILNSKKPRLKMSRVEKSLNLYLLVVFFFLLVCCLVCAIIHRFKYLSHKKFYDNFIIILKGPKTDSFIIFFTYFLLLNTMIPISLIVSTEIIKMIQGIFISWDIHLYSKSKHCFCGAKTVSIIEELGNVNFIFSDKTGTLTKNQLQFKYCIIKNKFYEYIKTGKSRKNKNKKKEMLEQQQKKINKKKIAYKNSLLNLFDSTRMRSRNSNIVNQMNNNMSKKNMLEENSSINELEDILSKNLNKKKNSCSNNNFFSNSRFTFLKKINDFEKSGFELLNISNDKKSRNNKDNLNENSKEKEKKNKENEKDLNSLNKSCKSEIKNNNTNNSNSSYTSSSNSSSDNENKNNNSLDDSKYSMHSSINNLRKNYVLIRREGRNSTIFEVREDNNSDAVSNITPFGEGYFSNPKNNPFLYNISSNDGKDFNYIHEFWKALALTNECMIKYEKGEIKYMSTSPDDLELVKAASRQGYKLIETSINTKTLKINGKDFSYEILKVLGFSSERKRMSIIVKDKNGIKLYIKGADSEIIKRLSKKSLENENYKIISNGLIDFSKKGLRTLMVAYRRIRQEDYDSWVNRLHEDELDIENKQRLIDRLYDLIENNLTLIGGTVVEDKLQNGVPETIKELRSAGIKIWVLTGDKLDTAENIGHSCNLLSKEQKLFTLKVMPGDDEKIVKEDPYPEMVQFFCEFQEFIEGLVKKYNLDTKYTFPNNKYTDEDVNNDNLGYSDIDSQNIEENNASESSYYSSRSKIIDFNSFNYLKERNLLEPFSIIIEAPILCGLFKDYELTDKFLNISYYSSTVICCRVSPSQKSEVIQKMKRFDKNAVTLAIGDGGNDVSMIMEANIGIGIYGEEGMSAAQASDFSIGEFQILKRLLFTHGRINLLRISKMILYFFYKNFVFTLTQFYFAFFCLASGQTFVDDWYITCYNLVFTAFPLCVSAITESDIDLSDIKITKKNLALLYKENRDTYKIFSFTGFLWVITKGVLISFTIFINSCFHEILNNKGNYSSIWYLSLKSYICVLIVVSTNLLIKSYFIVYLLPISIGITTFFLFIIFLILNHYGFLFQFNSKASIFSSFSSPLLYLSVLVVCCMSFIFDYSAKMITLLMSNSLSSKLILSRTLRLKTKSYSFDLPKAQSSKPYSIFLNKNKRNSVQISRNFLLNKMPLLLNQFNQQNTNTPKQNSGFFQKFQSTKNMKK